MTLFAIAAVLAFGDFSLAATHGGANRIMNSPDVGWCDCFWLEPKEVRVDGDRYVVDRFSIHRPASTGA